MKVSIVTITYNAARTLQRTLDSVACQTYADIEHLIIDGASKDDTLAIAERYQSQSRHTVVVRSEPDRGLYDAMNKGLQKATGEYLVFLNAGDSLYAPDTIETVVFMATPPSPMGRGISCICVVIVRQNSCRGNHSSMACWYVIRHSMFVRILLKSFHTTCNIDILQMSTGAFA